MRIGTALNVVFAVFNVGVGAYTGNPIMLAIGALNGLVAVAAIMFAWGK